MHTAMEHVLRAAKMEDPDSMPTFRTLATHILGSNWRGMKADDAAKTVDGREHFVDLDPAVFGCIINYLRANKIPDAETHVLENARRQAVRSGMKELADDLAKHLKIGVKCDFTRKEIHMLLAPSVPGPVVLTPVNLAGARLEGLDLSDMHFQGVNFTKACLKDVNFSGANLERAIMRGADMRGCNLTGAVCIGARFEGANLSEANLTDCESASANTTGCDFTGAISADAFKSGR